MGHPCRRTGLRVTKDGIGEVPGGLGVARGIACAGRGCDGSYNELATAALV